MIVASEQGHVCWSADGDAWNYIQVADRFTSPPIWTGTEFWIYSGAELFKSADALNWTSVTIEPANIAIGAFARSPAGTLVAATGSHPINFIRFGYLQPSSDCHGPLSP